MWGIFGPRPTLPLVLHHRHLWGCCLDHPANHVGSHSSSAPHAFQLPRAASQRSKVICGPRSGSSSEKWPWPIESTLKAEVPLWNGATAVLSIPTSPHTWRGAPLSELKWAEFVPLTAPRFYSAPLLFLGNIMTCFQGAPITATCRIRSSRGKAKEPHETPKPLLTRTNVSLLNINKQDSTERTKGSRRTNEEITGPASSGIKRRSFNMRTETGRQKASNSKNGSERCCHINYCLTLRRETFLECFPVQ